MYECKTLDLLNENYVASEFILLIAENNKHRTAMLYFYLQFIYLSLFHMHILKLTLYLTLYFKLATRPGFVRVQC
jgi:hypothetical protein